jgi:hypothetical protein
MSLSNEDFTELLQHLQARLRQTDQAIFERLSGVAITQAQPREQFFKYLFSIISVMKEGSSASYHTAVAKLGEFIKGANNLPIQGIRIALSPAERELYKVNEVDLSEMPDNSSLIDDLLAIARIVDQEDRQ